MAQNRFIFAASLVAQVETLTVGGTPASGQVYSVTMGLNSAAVVSYTATGTDTNSTIATALQAALAGSSFPQFQEITWTVSGAVITATAKTAGTPYTLTPAATGTGTLVAATIAANASPNDWDNAADWSANALPANGDDAYIDQTSQSIFWNLSSLSAITLNSLHIASTATGDYGLPEVNSSGSESYEEYRPRYIQVGATTVYIGDGDGPGSSLINLNTGSVATTLYVRQTGQGQIANLEALQWKGTNASNVVEVTRGQVALAGYGGDVATVATLTVAYVDNQDSDAFVRCGVGCTLTNVNQSGGTLEINSAVTTLTKTAGTLTISGSGAIGTLTAMSGTTNYVGTGTITDLVVGPTETFQVAEDKQARTVTNCTLYKGATLLDPFGSITFSNPIQLAADCRIGDVTVDLGLGRHLLPS